MPFRAVLIPFIFLNSFNALIEDSPTPVKSLKALTNLILSDKDWALFFSHAAQIEVNIVWSGQMLADKYGHNISSVL